MRGTRTESQPHPAHGCKQFGDWQAKMQNPAPGKKGFDKRTMRRSRMSENRQRLAGVIAKREERRARDMETRNRMRVGK